MFGHLQDAKTVVENCLGEKRAHKITNRCTFVGSHYVASHHNLKV